MKRVFLDTNILLDLVQNREGFSDAVNILQRAFEGQYSICTCVLSFANIAYILRKEAKDRRYKLLSLLKETVPMLPLMPNNVIDTIANPANDFEDMLQYQCAKANGCEVIITNNGKDYAEFCDLPIMTAAEFLKELGN